MSDIKELIEEQGRAFADFKSSFEEKLNAERDEREFLEAKLNRGALGSSGSIDLASPNANAHKTAFIDGFVRKGRDSDLAAFEAKAMSIGSDPDGGYMVPEILASQIDKYLLNMSPMRQIAQVRYVGGATYKQIISVGGAGSGWVGETSARTNTDTPTLKAIAPSVGEIYSSPAVTQQLLDDAIFDVEEYLSTELSLEFAVQENAAFITGDGLIKPKGLLSGDTSTLSDTTRPFGSLQYIVTGTSGDFPAANPADKLIDLIQTLRAPYRVNASWLMSSATLFTIRKMKNGDGDYIWQPSLTAGTPSTLMGYPVYECEDMPAMGAGSLSIAFGDFRRGYLIVDRQGPRMLRDPYTNKPYVNFYTTKRVGGSLLNDQAIKLLKFGTS